MLDKIIIFFDWILKDRSAKFKLFLDAPIKWPDRCAVCNKHPVEYNELNGRVLKGKPWGHDWTSLMTVRYPIKKMISVPLCSRHYSQIDWIIFLRFISFCAIIIFGIFVFSCSDQEPFLFLRFIKHLFLLFVSIGFYYFLIRLQPVRLTEIGDIFYSIVIKDKNYAKEFASINDYLKIELLSVTPSNNKISSWRYLKNILSLHGLVLIILAISLVLVLVLNHIFFKIKF